MALVDEKIDRLDGLSTFELRTLWLRHWKQPPPMRLSKDLMIRGLAWKLQERAFGGVGKAEQRKLSAIVKAAGEQQVAEGGENGDATELAGANKAASSTRAISTVILREGNRLVREWNGTTRTVLVLAVGFEWQKRQYRSLSQIAEAITGAHWSGPRFFGLTKRNAAGRI